MSYIPPPSYEGSYTLANISVVDVQSGNVIPARDVHIADGVIASILPADEHATGETRIDGTGRYLVPGFVDAHMHPLNYPKGVEATYALMLASGIVGYRQMAGSQKMLDQRSAKTLPQPLGAPDLLALPGDLLTPFNAGTPDDARAAVREQHRQGADFIKAGFTTRETFLAALDEARALGIPLAGHLPTDLDPREAAEHGVRCIEHLGPGATVFEAVAGDEETLRKQAGPVPKLPNLKLPSRLSSFVQSLVSLVAINPALLTKPEAAAHLHASDVMFDERKAHELAKLFVERETWHCPTLIRLHTQQFANAPQHCEDPRAQYMARSQRRAWNVATRRFRNLPEVTRRALRDHWAAQMRLTKVFADDGVPMLAGTDACGANWVIPGFALHDEFDLLAESGVKPLDVLRMTTLNPAQFFSRSDRAGAVRSGFVADLVILREDPTHDVKALHSLDAVIRNGAMWERGDLDAILVAAKADPQAR